MNYLKLLIGAGALLVSASLFAADSFVGKVTMAMTDAKGKTTVMNQSMKGTSTRTDVAGMPGGVIMDFAKREMIVLMNEQHMYMAMPIKLDQVAHESKTASTEDPEIVVTGKTETILGYPCKQIMVTEAKKVTELWVAEGLGMFGGLGGPGGGGGMFGKKKGTAESAKWEQAFKGKGGFPLRVITRDVAGTTTFKMEATKIDKGGVTDADFQPPADFQKFEMPDFGGMNPFK